MRVDVFLYAEFVNRAGGIQNASLMFPQLILIRVDVNTNSD